MDSPSPSSPRSRWKAVLLLVLVFMLGAGCGLGGGLLVLRQVAQRVISQPEGDGAPVDFIVGHLESEIVAEMDLTEAERDLVHTELRQAAGHFKNLRAEVWQKSRSQIRETLDRICSRVAPEKKERLRAEAIRRLRPWGLLSDEE